MTSHCTCLPAGRAAARPFLPGPRVPVAPRRRRAGELIAWVASGLGLALVPKCPACLAAQIALVTGAGISASAASQVSAGWIGVCVASLLGLSLRRLWRARASRRSGCGSTFGAGNCAGRWL
jgi:hypothetical protein